MKRARDQATFELRIDDGRQHVTGTNDRPSTFQGDRAWQ
jgi:hypothetical protein